MKVGEKLKEPEKKRNYVSLEQIIFPEAIFTQDLVSSKWLWCKEEL